MFHSVNAHAPRFGGVTYLGSKVETQGPGNSAHPGLPSYKTSVHEFQLDGNDKKTYRMYSLDGDKVQLRDTQVYSPYPGDNRSGLDRVLEVTVPIDLGDPKDPLLQRVMVLSSREAKLIDGLIDKAQAPPADKIGGSPDPFMGPLNPQHKPYFHVDNPTAELWSLDSVKTNLRMGLTSNLFKQLMSVSFFHNTKQPLTNLMNLLKKAKC